MLKCVCHLYSFIFDYVKCDVLCINNIVFIWVLLCEIKLFNELLATVNLLRPCNRHNVNNVNVFKHLTARKLQSSYYPSSFEK